ncbi:hypothetical protein LTR84_006714 [Exophiala bonariae]|uniref:Sulfatase N-terminal domain-containing protein n=1 Tax=Exophiala bonariae TaxID=1690606 RepID=A0AAV9N1W1_9EURO|nr:hypothetical protein LTR84_006714 [Exophiala bonariae]
MFSSVWAVLASIACLGVAAPTPSKRPNIVFIITDDQDLHLSSLDYMPITMKQVRDAGTTFKKHYCTIALCCPSRVSLLTGKAAHNTNVTDVSPPFGGYPKFIQQGHNKNYLPVWLQAGGYDTYYTGKLMNAHSIMTWNNPYPAGWNHTNYLVDPGTYVYNNACWQADTTPPIFRPGQYSTDVIASTAEKWIEEATLKTDRPFFMGIAPIAPHTETDFFSPGVFAFVPPVPAKRHEGLFPNATIPRGPSFNPSKPQGVSWVGKLAQANDTVIKANDEFYRKRLQALQSVDELVGAVIDKLDEQGILNDTYIIYTTDNGFHMGQHRLPPGKTCAFEEDVNIPFLIRGPGIPINHTVNFATSHTDLAPTILQLAGIPLRDDFDGTPMPLSLVAMKNATDSPMHDHVTIEFWGDSGGERLFQMGGPLGTPTRYHKNTYKAMRIVSKDYDLLYTVWCTNEHELYNMKVNGQSLKALLPRLDAVLMVLKSCKGEQCLKPWKTLHPDGSVYTLSQALAPEYDEFYATQPKVAFTACEIGYIVRSEGPQKILPFHIGD